MKGCFILIIATAALLFVGVIGLCVYRYADTAQAMVHTGEGTVTHLRHKSAWTQFVRQGNSHVPIRHREKWRATVQVGEQSDTVDIKESLFDQLSEGDEVNVAYKLGVYSNSLYITNLKP